MSAMSEEALTGTKAGHRHAWCDVNTPDLAVEGVVPLDLTGLHPLPEGHDVALVPRAIGRLPAEHARIDHSAPSG